MVTQIDWEKNKVTIQTNNGKQYTGQKCIVTVPLDFLQKTNPASINFQPSLGDHINAAKEIGYGTVIKVVLEFSDAFWTSYAKDIAFIISDEKIPTWWTEFPDTVPLLTGWKGGPGAEELSNKDDEEILQIALSSLSAVFKMTIPEIQQKIVASKIFNWLTEKYANGAYSYPWPSSKKAKRIMNMPVDDTIFFAGEALYDKESSGTVEAALISGKEAADKVRKPSQG
jgi:monoamine oxidase